MGSQLGENGSQGQVCKTRSCDLMLRLHSAQGGAVARRKGCQGSKPPGLFPLMTSALCNVSSPVFIIDLIPKAGRVDHRQFHSHSFLLNIWAENNVEGHAHTRTSSEGMNSDGRMLTVTDGLDVDGFGDPLLRVGLYRLPAHLGLEQGVHQRGLPKTTLS